MDFIPITPSSIPQELINAIVDMLRSDISSLQTCSLVSLTFSLPSRAHLFTRIRLNSAERSTQFGHLLESNARIRYWVQELRLIHSGSWIVDEGSKTLPFIFQSLSRLHLFSLSCRNSHEFRDLALRWNTLPAALESSFFDLFASPSLKTIALESIHRFPIAKLSRCNGAQNISLIRVQLNAVDSEGMNLNEISENSQIESRSLAMLDDTALSYPPSRLRRLTLSLLTLDEVTAASGIIFAAAASLEHLEIHHNEYMSGPDLPESSAFTLQPIERVHMPNLRSLVFDVVIAWFNPNGMAPWLCPFLEKMANTNQIETIIVSMKDGVFVAIDSWMALDAVLSSSSYSSLRHVTISPPGYPLVSMETMLPSLASRGILTVVSSV